MSLEDTPALQRIAATSFIHSRFYFDQHFSREKCQTYYEIWAKKSCEGRVDFVLVADESGNPVGYVTGVISKEEQEVRIELIAVEQSKHGMGVGEKLLRNSLKYADRGTSSFMSVRQGVCAVCVQPTLLDEFCMTFSPG